MQATDLDRNTAANFISFLDDLDAAVAADLQVHLVLDNRSSPSPAIWAGGWLTTLASIPPHPTHPWWLHQLELFFSILARRLLKRGELRSVETWWPR